MIVDVTKYMNEYLLDDSIEVGQVFDDMNAGEAFVGAREFFTEALSGQAGYVELYDMICTAIEEYTAWKDGRPSAIMSNQDCAQTLATITLMTQDLLRNSTRMFKDVLSIRETTYVLKMVAVITAMYVATQHELNDLEVI